MNVIKQDIFQWKTAIPVMPRLVL